MSREFLDTSSLDKALDLINKTVPLGTSKETCHLDGAPGRIIAEDIKAPEDLPPFSKSTVDGYAVVASDTYGASEGTPVFLNLIGEVEAGKEGFRSLTIGTNSDRHKEGRQLYNYSTVYIPTGGMLPEGADAVIMIEYTQRAGENMIEVSHTASPGENIIHKGEDIKEGGHLFLKGHQLRPQDIGVLAGMGITRIEVYSRPKVGIISTGAEICAVDKRPQRGQIRDINACTLSAFIKKFGGEPLYMGIHPDDLERIKGAVLYSIERVDCILISGGSSVGTRDFTYQVISDLGPPGVLLYGLSIRPGKPTIIGQSGPKPIIGLPGHPASAIIVAESIVRPIVYRLSGLSPSPLEANIKESAAKVFARLTRNIPSQPGKEEFIKVALSLDERGEKDLLATPIFGKSGLISTFINAHGILRIPADSEGAYEGETLEVMLI